MNKDTVVAQVVMGRDEYEKLREVAKASGLSFSAYARLVLLSTCKSPAASYVTSGISGPDQA